MKDVFEKENGMILTDCGIPVHAASKSKLNKGDYIRAEGRLDAHLAGGGEKT